MSRTPVAAVAAASLLVSLPAAGIGKTVVAGRHTAMAAATTPAPGAPGDKAVWPPADKDGFGTARGVRSAVWFTLQDGRLSEVFYPDLSTPSVRSLEFVVTDGETFTDRTAADPDQRTRRTDSRSLSYEQTHVAAGRYRLTVRYAADRARPSLALDVRLASIDGRAYQVYALYDPSLDNGGMDDTGRSSGDALVATDASGGRVASALVAEPAFDQTSSGYLGVSDGWTDLEADHTMDWSYLADVPGNVVQTGRLGGLTGLGSHRHTTLTLGFGQTADSAVHTARRTLDTGFARVASAYADGWHRYLDGLRGVPAPARRFTDEYLASVMVLAAAEDKRHRGAFIASPTEPWVWGQEIPDLSSPSGAYHLVWARDAYQFGTALWAAGDRAAARRIVDWLFRVQQKADGSFPQNSDVTGTPVWTNLQLDEVALPIVLAWQVGRDDAATYRHVRRAADFLVHFRDPVTGLAAPYSPQDRWENQAGYSPGSIAAQVAGLVCAADLARRNGDGRSARSWLRTADDWRRRIEGWTLTTNGALADRPYYLRLTKDGRPNAATTYSIGDGGPSAIDQRAVVDQSFLDLVRLGVKPADGRHIAATLRVVDRELATGTPNGMFWHRYEFDGYGETRSGGDWHTSDPDTFDTLGRVWPILAGERGEYVLARGGDATRFLVSMALAANAGDMAAEQVWDDRPPAGEPGFRPGEGTFSATPLVWSHAQLVRLAWSIQAGRPVETPAVVARRYAD